MIHEIEPSNNGHFWYELKLSSFFKTKDRIYKLLQIFIYSKNINEKMKFIGETLIIFHNKLHLKIHSYEKIMLGKKLGHVVLI